MTVPLSADDGTREPPVRLEATPAPELTEAERGERLRLAMERAPAYGMELLPPPGA